jgi:hypothetical protein
MTLMASGFGAMALLYLIFSKLVPIIAVWELKVGMQESHAGAAAPALEHREASRAPIGDVS